jgi:pilus assembly protein CpaC
LELQITLQVTLGSDVTAALVNYPSNFTAAIKALDKKGLFKTLAEPNLVVKSGEKGRFLAGQRIPFTTTNVGAVGGTATNVQFEDVGVKLEFAPVILKDGFINLKIDPVEVSTVDPSTPTVLSQGQFPIINKRSTSTVVDLKEGDSLLLSGLILNQDSRAISKFPILGDIPIIGALFRSKNFQNNETELIVIITPLIKKPFPKGEVPDLKAMTTITPGEEDKVRWIPLVPDLSEGVVKEDKKEETKKEEAKKEETKKEETKKEETKKEETKKEE